MARGVVLDPHRQRTSLDPVSNIGIDVELQGPQAGRLRSDRDLRRIRIHHRDAGSFASRMPQPYLDTRQECDLDQRAENDGENRQEKGELDGRLASLVLIPRHDR